MYYTENGLIGKSGKWYSCNVNGHIMCSLKNIHDKLFVFLRTHLGDSYAAFDEYYTDSKSVPTRKQFETLMDWCTATGNSFEDITDCYDEPWREYA